METNVTKREIREAVKTLNVKNLYIYAKTMKMDVCDVINSCGCARKLKGDAHYTMKSKESNTLTMYSTEEERQR